MLEASGFDFAGNVVVPEIPPASSDRSSVVARLRQRINELEGKLEVGVGIPVPDNRSSYATLSSASALPARVDVPPGLSALPQVRSHGHGQDPPPPPPIGVNADEFEDDGPLLWESGKFYTHSDWLGC